MTFKSWKLILALCSLLFAGAWDSYAQDTLKVRIYFPQGKGDAVDLSFAGNGERMAVFEEQLSNALREGAYINGVFIQASASPEGTKDFNARLSRKRADVMGSFFIEKLGVNPGLVLSKSLGEDWDGLVSEIRELDVPWKADALTIIQNYHNSDSERCKTQLKLLAGGRAWAFLLEDTFPKLRSAKCDAIVTLSRPEQKVTDRTDTLYIEVPVVEEKIVEVPVPVPVEVDAGNKRKPYNLEGKRMIFAIRTNVLAVPFTNVGVEVPIGQHFSVGVDWYSPWMWRKNHSAGIDEQGWSFEIQALCLEGRYWFTNRKKKPEQRLLGHSVGVYAATGHYDFERNYSGHQGKYFNVGVDYMYACPIFGGRMHLEFELGLGYIQSPATPYDTFEPGGKAYRQVGVTKNVRWFGPTRAGVSLVVPIYVKKGGKR